MKDIKTTYCMISFLLYRHKFLVYKDKITGILLRLTISRGQRQRAEKVMATHSSTLVWRVSWTEETGGLQSMGLQELDITQRLNHRIYVLHLLYPFIYQWACRLLPQHGYWKQCCSEHQGVFIFLNLFWIYAQEWDCWIIC